MSHIVKTRAPGLKSLPSRAPRRSLRVPSKTKYRGLCSTCVNAPDCTFPRTPGQAVFHCEEFDGGRPLLREMAGAERAAQTAPRAAKKKDSVKFIGLCSNCDNRKTCVFPKPKSGVWHCEEYV